MHSDSESEKSKNQANAFLPIHCPYIYSNTSAMKRRHLIIKMMYFRLIFAIKHSNQGVRGENLRDIENFEFKKAMQHICAEMIQW